MKLEVGKRYVMRNGEVTGQLSYNGHDIFPFTAETSIWTKDGKYWSDDEECHLDIVSEYIEPASEPLRWVENCKPDKPGIWARRGAAGEIVAIDVVKDTSLSWVLSTRCYLGPIPEILPPKKKVVQRLWLKDNTRVCRDAVSAIYDESWIDDDSTPADGCWIRTDKTREVEQ